MKITSLDLYKVPPRWVFLKVTTDEGIVGWGEPIVEGRADTVIAAVKEISGYLIGQDPSRIEDLFQVMHRGGFYRGGPVLTSAISGIDQALWDIKGRALGVPVYELLGGRARDRIRVYNWVGGDRPADLAAAIARRLENGFTAVKMNATEEMHYLDDHGEIDSAIARMAAAREAGGAALDIAVDFHGRVHKGMAKTLVRELEPYRPYFIEEPVPPENLEALREIARYTSAPIAVGERLFTRWGFKDVIAQGVVDIVQPDVSHAGGIWELRKIAAMAEAYDIGVAPHCPLGPIAFAASLQLDACTPNVIIQEQSLGIHYNVGNDLLDYVRNRDAFTYHEGYLEVPSGPGLGVDIDEELVVERARVGHDWKNPVWRNVDGTVAEW
ncbi:galactonate dehydratase [soil metagenome]